MITSEDSLLLRMKKGCILQYLGPGVGYRLKDPKNLRDRKVVKYQTARNVVSSGRIRIIRKEVLSMVKISWEFNNA